MGRWGMRLFEGDQDLDLADDINYEFGKDLANHARSSLGQAKENDKMKVDEPELPEICEKTCAELDAGKCDYLFDMYRTRENKYDGKYQVIILGAMMMRAGARIRPDDMSHLRELVSQVNSNAGFTLPMSDNGFRGPGRAQFLAALDSFKAGIPRDFRTPSCYECGKMKDDLAGVTPPACSRCQDAWYCTKECQRAHWKDHKPSCGPKGTLLNV